MGPQGKEGGRQGARQKCRAIWKQDDICFLWGDSDARWVSSESCNRLVARNMDSSINRMVHAPGHWSSLSSQSFRHVTSAIVGYSRFAWQANGGAIGTRYSCSQLMRTPVWELWSGGVKYFCPTLTLPHKFINNSASVAGTRYYILVWSPGCRTFEKSGRKQDWE